MKSDVCKEKSIEKTGSKWSLQYLFSQPEFQICMHLPRTSRIRGLDAMNSKLASHIFQSLQRFLVWSVISFPHFAQIWTKFTLGRGQWSVPLQSPFAAQVNEFFHLASFLYIFSTWFVPQHSSFAGTGKEEKRKSTVSNSPKTFQFFCFCKKKTYPKYHFFINLIHRYRCLISSHVLISVVLPHPSPASTFKTFQDLF